MLKYSGEKGPDVTRQPTAEEYESIVSTWSSFMENQEASILSSGDDDTSDTSDDGDSSAESETEPSTTDGDQGEVVFQVNERVAAQLRESEEEATEKAKKNDNEDPDDVFVDSRKKGVELHYDEEAREAVVDVIAEEMGVSSVYENNKESEHPDHEVMWPLDISTDEKFGPFSPNKFDIRPIVERVAERGYDITVVSDVYEIE